MGSPEDMPSLNMNMKETCDVSYLCSVFSQGPTIFGVFNALLSVLLSNYCLYMYILYVKLCRLVCRW